MPSYADRSSVFVADRSSTFSDGRVGIGLSLLQGMADGDRMSNLWSESGDSGESIADHLFPPPPSNVPIRPSHGSTVSSNNTDGGKRLDTGTMAGEWDGEDIYNDYYRNSRLSVNSRMSGRSRATSSALTQHKVPPVPDLEYRRPSLETASITSAGSPTPEDVLERDGPSQPASPVPEKTKPLNIRRQGDSLTTPESSPLLSDYNTAPLRLRSASPTAGPSTVSIVSAMRQNFESDRAESSMSGSRTPQDTEHDLGSPTQSKQGPAFPPSDVPLVVNRGPSPPSTSPPRQEPQPQARPRVLDSNCATALGMPRARSLFMPHPHAPKAKDPSTGQISSRSQAIYEAMSSNADVLQSTIPANPPGYTPQSMSLLSLLALAAANARVKATTVYGQTQVDLSTSFDPVPITFSLEGQPESQQNSMATKKPGPRAGQPGRSNTSDGVLRPESTMKMGPIPRANFFPKVGTPRPRSRSFSGFSGTEVAIPVATRCVFYSIRLVC